MPSRTNDQWSLDRWPDSGTVGMPSRCRRDSSVRSGSPSSALPTGIDRPDADPVHRDHAPQRSALGPVSVAT